MMNTILKTILKLFTEIPIFNYNENVYCSTKSYVVLNCILMIIFFSIGIFAYIRVGNHFLFMF